MSSALTLLGLSAAGQGDPSGLDIRWLAAAVAAVCTAAIAIGSNFGGRLRVELHQGRIYLQWFESAPTGAPDLEFSSVQVSLPQPSFASAAVAKASKTFHYSCSNATATSAPRNLRREHNVA